MRERPLAETHGSACPTTRPGIALRFGAKSLHHVREDNHMENTQGGQQGGQAHGQTQGQTLTSDTIKRALNFATPTTAQSNVSSSISAGVYDFAREIENVCPP